MREFKDVHKNYTDQLIRVKVCAYRTRFLFSVFNEYSYCKIADMANNDLEKYAKALDKYVVLPSSRQHLTFLQCHHEVPLVEDGGSQ